MKTTEAKLYRQPELWVLAIGTVEVTDGVLQKDLYIAFFPQKTSEAEPYSLVFTLDGKNYSYEWTATKKYQAGTMYTLKDKSVDVSISKDDPISFADPAVKAICVAKFDTDGDSEVSYAEAAAVTGWSNYASRITAL